MAALARVLSGTTTPEYEDRFLEVDLDASSEDSYDSEVTPRAGVTLEVKRYSDDGVHYFSTAAQLKAWRRKVGVEGGGWFFHVKSSTATHVQARVFV